MSIDLDRLSRIEAKLDLVLTRLESAKDKAPNLKMIEFAELAGVSRRTVQRDINRGIIRTIRGRIPRTELTKYMS